MNEYPNNNGRSTGGMLGFLVGAAVGAGIALLLAPASGPETRRRLGQSARRFGVSMKDGVGHAQERLGTLKGEVNDRLGSLREDVNTAVAAGRDAFARERDSRANPTSQQP